MKRMISLCCAGLMAFSLAACGSQNAASSSTSTPQVTSAVVGKITALDGTTVTLQLGELTENQPGDPPSQDGAQPSGDNASGDSSASGQTQTPPEKTEGDNNTQGTGDGSSSTDAQNDPPSDGQGSAPGSTFTAGEETTTVDLSGATVTIQDATITSNAQGGNGVFSYGKGTTVNLSDSAITTQKDNSGGIQTTGGGTTNATNLTVETNGNSSAAIRSDRGGGTVNVEKGTYTSKGYNSPAVYSTANITVKNAALTAENSEALVVEGKNSITLENCDVSGSMSDSKGTSSSENVHNVMIYQSMSGDAETGTANFSMTGGKLTSSNGDQFYVTNTDCNITLSGVTLVNKDKNGKLLRVTGNSASHGWGTAGKNGAQVTFTADAQTMEGDMEVDTISTLDLTLKNNSTFTGAIQIVDNADGGTAVENNAVVTIEKGSKWVLTGDCTITSLTNNGTIDFNGHTITLADSTVLKG